MMAVSITYPDNMVIQLLPALRTKAGLKVPAVQQRGWSDIDPEGFRQALTSVNDRCGGKLIPTIKLAKAVIANMPEAYRLTGYHVESLAIEAFKKYEGKKTTETILPLFFDKSKEPGSFTNTRQHRTIGTCRRIPRSGEQRSPPKR